MCVEEKAIIVDDCLPVSLSAVVIAEASVCTTTVEVTATATGCGQRPDFDVTTARITGLKVDSIAPTVECGFLPSHDDNSINMIDGKTLYHYMGGHAMMLNDARLFYNLKDS